MTPLDDADTDLQLIARANSGDWQAFEQLFHRYKDWVLRLALRFNSQHDDARDVVQETFVYLAGKFPHFELRARMTTFLYPVVKHLALNQLRRQRKHKQLPLEQLPPHLEALPQTQQDPQEGLSAAVATLSAPQREVVLLRFVDGLSLGEVAQALGIPEGTVKSRLHQALTKLREDPRTQGYFEH